MKGSLEPSIPVFAGAPPNRLEFRVLPASVRRSSRKSPPRSAQTCSLELGLECPHFRLHLVQLLAQFGHLLFQALEPVVLGPHLEGGGFGGDLGLGLDDYFYSAD